MKRALIIGINYQTRELTLNFAESDALKFRNFIQRKYPRMQIRTLIGSQATSFQIRDNLKDLVNITEPGDTLFFYFSGHGIQIPDTNGDECDGKDEAILGFEAKNFRDRSAMIIDDEFKRIIGGLPQGSHFRGVLDACHSGTLFDLSETITILETDNKTFGICKLTPNSVKSYAMILSSSVDAQSSYEDNAGGIFTRALVNSDLDVDNTQLIQNLTRLLKGIQTPMLSFTHRPKALQDRFF